MQETTFIVSNVNETNNEENRENIEDKNKSSLFSACANFFNSIIGAGIVTFPDAMKKGGVYFGLTSMIICAVLIYYISYLMISIVIKKPQIKTYADMCKEGLGDIGYYYVSSSIFFMLYGAMVVYNILIRFEMTDIISDFMGETFQYGKLVLLACALLLMLPPSLLKSISKLASVSIVSTIGVLLIVLIVCIRSPTYYKALNEMTPKSMKTIEKSLNKERALWICSLSQKPYSSPYLTVINSWNINEVINYSELFDYLNENEVCELKLSSQKMSEYINDFQEISVPKFKELSNSIKTWADVIGEAHSKYLFNNWSLNKEGEQKREFHLHSFIRIQFILVFGTISSAFICQPVILLLYNSLRVKNMKQYHKLHIISFTLIICVYLIIALVGYYTQSYQAIDLVFMKMKPRFYGLKSPDYAVNIGRIILVITIVLTYPIQLFIARHNFIIIIRGILNRINQYDNLDGNMTNIMFYSCTFFIFTSSLLLGTFFDKAAILYSFIGAAFASPLIYILPVLCWYSINGGIMFTIRDSFKKGGSFLLWGFILPIFVLVFGVISTFLSILGNALGVANVFN